MAIQKAPEASAKSLVKLYASQHRMANDGECSGYRNIPPPMNLCFASLKDRICAHLLSCVSPKTSRQVNLKMSISIYFKII